MLLRIEHGDTTLTWPPRIGLAPEVVIPEDGSPPRLGPGQTWRAAYDALGRRLWTQLGHLRREFYWDGDRIAAEVSHDGQLRIYQYASSTALVSLAFTDYANAEADPASGKTYHVFSDPVGMPLCIEDEDGRVVWWARRVDPYGCIDVRADAKIEYNFRWPGHYFDPETGLHYNRHRYYDPKLGRYLQCDPTGYSGSPVNLYAYCKNPLVHVDVLGLHDPEDAAPAKPTDGAPTKTGAEDPAAAPEGSTAPPSDGLARAAAARDAALAEIKALPSKQRNQVATVVGAHDPATGQVAVGVKRSGTDHGKCAEDLAAEALGNPDPKTIEFTPVIRPRNDDTIPRCERCTETFGPEKP